jgi:hypothetical protein
LPCHQKKPTPWIKMPATAFELCLAEILQGLE